MPGKTIKILSDRERGSSPVRINGIGRDLPHNKEVAVTEDELALLENSNLAYEVVGNASRSELKAAEGEAGDKPPALSPQLAGGDFLPTRDPAEDEAPAAPAASRTRGIDQEAGGDNLAGSVAHGAAAADGAKADPLDHDGDGRKGGSKPRRAKGGSET